MWGQTCLLCSIFKYFRGQFLGGRFWGRLFEILSISNIWNDVEQSVLVLVIFLSHLWLESNNCHPKYRMIWTLRNQLKLKLALLSSSLCLGPHYRLYVINTGICVSMLLKIGVWIIPNLIFLVHQAFWTFFYRFREDSKCIWRGWW